MNVLIEPKLSLSGGGTLPDEIFHGISPRVYSCTAVKLMRSTGRIIAAGNLAAGIIRGRFRGNA